MTDRTGHSRSDREEDIRVVTLKDLATQGWKSNNGFRAGYLGKLEEAVKRHCPGSDIKATPHIVSKITAWKRTYNLLQGILSRSGVGYNTDGDYKIDVDDEQWSRIIRVTFIYTSYFVRFCTPKHCYIAEKCLHPQAEPSAGGIRTKAWPYWPIGK